MVNLRHEKNPYIVLNVPRNAPIREIKQSYRKLARLYHPDRQSDTANAKKFAEIAAAYAILSDPFERAAYDVRSSSTPSSGDCNEKKDVHTTKTKKSPAPTPTSRLRFSATKKEVLLVVLMVLINVRLLFLCATTKNIHTLKKDNNFEKLLKEGKEGKVGLFDEFFTSKSFQTKEEMDVSEIRITSKSFQTKEEMDVSVPLPDSEAALFSALMQTSNLANARKKRVRPSIRLPNHKTHRHLRNRKVHIL